MKNRILLGLIPVMASAAIVAGGYSAWVFGATDQATGTVSINVTDEVTNSSAGKFVVTGLNTYKTIEGAGNQAQDQTNSGDEYELVLDQTATELNTTGAGAHFENSLSIVFNFSNDVSTNYDGGAGTNKYNYNFTLSLTVSESLLNYVSFTYGDVTIAKDDVSSGVATKAIKTESNYSYAGSNYTLFDSASTNLTVAYVDEPKSSDEYTAMKAAIADATITFTAKCEAVMITD